MPQADTAPIAPAAEARNLPLQTRVAPVATVDPEARTVELVWTTGGAVRRFDYASWSPYIEELSLDPAHIRMGRLEAGAPLLDTHAQYQLSSVLGVIERAWMTPTEGRALARFSRRDDVAGRWLDVADGIVRNVSVGYIVHRYEKTDPIEPGGIPTWRAIDWEPAEISLVPVGADAGAGVRAMGPDVPDVAANAPQAAEMRQQLAEQALQAVGRRSYPCRVSPPPVASAAVPQPPQQETAMPMDETNVQARGTSTAHAHQGDNTHPAAGGQPSAEQIRAEERQRGSAIRAAVATARRTAHGVNGLDDAFAQRLIDTGVTLDQARAQIFEQLAAHSDNTGPTRSAAAIETMRDEQEQRRLDMAAAVAHRAHPAGQLPETARRFRGLTLPELARVSLESQGVRTEGLSRHEIVATAMGNGDGMGFRSLHGTSDFTIALASTVNRSLRMGYESAQRTFTRWARPGTLSDFRAATRVSVAGNLALEKVNQFGEFKRGKMVDGGESIQLATYGKVVGVTRQAVINDDLDFLSRLPAMFGRAAADFESDIVYGILTANAAMADGTALFHADHGNLAGTGAAISETTLSAARLALRKQTDPSGNAQPLNLLGRYLLVPAALETAAQKQINAVIVASKTSDTNVFQNSYEVVTEPRLDANSATSWYLMADSSQIDTIEYAYLEGEQGLYTEQRTGFDVDGLEVKARLDFAAKAIDHRGLYKNAGA